MRIRDYKKQLITIAIFLLCLLAVWLYPLKAVNVTIQMNFSGVKDGASVVWMASQENVTETVSTATVYSQQAQFRLDPVYYNFDFIQLQVIDSVDNNEVPVLETVRAYSGEYNISIDKIIAECSINAPFHSSGDGNYGLQFSQEVAKQLKNAFHQNMDIRWTFTAIVAVVFALVLLFMSKQRHKLWNQVLRYGLIVICGIVVIFILFNTDFYRKSTQSMVPLATALENNVQGEATKNTNLRGVSLNTPVSQSFRTSYNQLQLVQLFFQVPAIEEGEELSGEVGVRLLDEHSNVVASNVFTLSDIQETGYVDLQVRDSASQAGSIYTLEVVSVSEEFPEEFQLLIQDCSEVDGQQLIVQGETVSNVAMRCDVGYANISPVPQIRIAVLIFLVLLLVFVACYGKLHIKPSVASLVIYGAMFIYAVYQVWFYMTYVGNTPDESAHVSYIAYLAQTGRIIPDFSQMQMMNIVGNTGSFIEGSVNQLGHPPLYYLVMLLCHPIDVLADNSFLIHFNKLRWFSAGFGLLALALTFYLGYTRITKKRPALHLLYCAIITSVPMFLYNISGVNNDTFALLGCVVFFWGVLRICEEKKNFGSYLLIAVGLFVAVLSKVTAGMLIGLTAIIFVVWYCVHHKSIRLIFCKEFMVTLPVYLAAAVYFVVVYMRFHTLQPDLSSINPEYYQISGFFVDFEDRTVMSVFDYFIYYWENFFNTWTAVASHTSLYKLVHWTTYSRIFTLAIPFVPILLFFVNKSRKYVVLLIGSFVSLVVVAWMQFQRAFETYFYISGYAGAYQTRYYLCVLPILAFAAVYLLQILAERKEEPKANLVERHSGMIILSPARVAVIVSIAASTILCYSGFVYFLFNYSHFNL